AKPAKQLGVVRRVDLRGAAGRPRPPPGANARRAAQRKDLQPRVVGHRGKAAQPGEVLRLPSRVPLEALGQLKRLLTRRLEETETIGEHDLDAGWNEDPADLLLFPSASGGSQQLHRPSARR